MNIKRFVIAGLAVFVVLEALNFVIHSVILMSAYESLKGLWRPDMMEKMWVMWIAEFVFAFLFVYIFTKVRTEGNVLEGLRYGLLIGLLVPGVGAFSSYAIYPLPFTLIIQWFIYGIVQLVVAGIAAALIYKSE